MSYISSIYVNRNTFYAVYANLNNHRVLSEVLTVSWWAVSRNAAWALINLPLSTQTQKNMEKDASYYNWGIVQQETFHLNHVV